MEQTNTAAFFPTEDYKIPSSSNYFKFKDGENTFRVLSPAVVGYEYWNNEGKPVRSKTAFATIPADIRTGDDGKPERIKHFWAFLVWNYDQKQVQILQLTQKGVMEAIKALVDNTKWGNPTGYDITVSRSGSGLETKYQTMPSPHTMVPGDADAAMEGRVIDLQKLFTGGDPFEVSA